jgi:acetaldehyde dehydrogenase/alcohol dehydrogenase
MHNGSAIAGMAFANAFLGICHSCAHQLGAQFHIPHGTANAIMLTHVIAFNATRAPTKMAAFSQYKYPVALEAYAEIADVLKLTKVTNEPNTMQDTYYVSEEHRLSVVCAFRVVRTRTAPRRRCGR